MDQYKNLKKEELLAKLEEITNTTEVGTIIAERDALKLERSTLLSDADKTTEVIRDLRHSVQQLKDKQQELEKSSGSAEEVEELTRQVKDLSDRLAANEDTKGDDRPVVTVAGEPHMIMFRKVQIKDREYTAKELAGEKKLLEQLKEMGSSALVAVSELNKRKKDAERKKAEREKKA